MLTNCPWSVAVHWTLSQGILLHSTGLRGILPWGFLFDSLLHWQLSHEVKCFSTMVCVTFNPKIWLIEWTIQATPTYCKISCYHETMHCCKAFGTQALPLSMVMTLPLIVMFLIVALAWVNHFPLLEHARFDDVKIFLLRLLIGIFCCWIFIIATLPNDYTRSAPLPWQWTDPCGTGRGCTICVQSHLSVTAESGQSAEEPLTLQLWQAVQV